MDTEKVTRLEVIDETGRILVLREGTIRIEEQDEGRTIKVFVKREEL